MANEITVNGSLCVTDATSPTVALQSGDVLATLAVDQREFKKLSIPITTPTAIPVTGLTAPGWALFLNRDATNFITLYTDNGANKKAFAKLAAGKLCGPIFLGTDAKAPYAVADTAACILEFLILDT